MWLGGWWLGAFATLPEDPNSLTNIYITRLTTACNSSSKGSSVQMSLTPVPGDLMPSSSLLGHWIHKDKLKTHTLHS